MSDLSLKKETPESFYLSPKEAGILVGYTADYVSKLSRDGEIVAKRDGRNWLVEGNSLKAFAARVVIEEKKRLEALKEERAKAYKASREFLPLREAGLLFGYTPDYLAKLCRDGAVQAQRDGREWFVERASLEDFATKIKLGETSRLESLRDARTKEYQKNQGGLFSVFKKKNGESRYPIFASTALGLGVFFLIFFFSYGFLFSGIDFKNFAKIFRPSSGVVQQPLATSTSSIKNEPVAMVTNYNTYNNTYNNTTNEYNSQTIEGISSADLAIELQGFKNTVLSQVYGAISNISSNVSGNTHAIQLTNRIDQLASVNISGSTFTGGTITNSSISGGTGSFTTLSVGGDTNLASTTITGPFTLTSTATTTFSNGLNLLAGCFSINGVCLSTTGGGSSSGGTWSTTTSSVTGQFVNYSTNSTDIVAIGGSATTSAKYWFDPNTQVSYISGSIGMGTTSPFARFSLAGANGSTSNLFAISTSTLGATTTALTIDSAGNLSLLNGANATISGTLTLAHALGIGSGGTGTSTAPAYGQFLVGNATGGYDYVATSSLGSAGGVTSLQQLGGGSAQTGAITLATSSDTNLLLNVTNSGGAF
ncbi:MAG: mucin-like protein, partial [Parcubacteria group bacterium Greene0714_7]